MKLKIVRTPPVAGYFSGHVTVYACDDVDPLLQAKGDIYNFDYMEREGPSLTKLGKNAVVDFDHADKNSVILESRISLDEFMKKINSSKFKNGQNFHGKSQNCIHATLYAIEEAAQIDLKIDKQTKSFKHLLLCCWGYTNIITPRELIQVLKKRESELETSPLLNKSIQ